MHRANKTLYGEKKGHYYNSTNPYLLKHIKKEWKEVLDIGCSNGTLGAAIKENGARVFGIEVFPEAAEKAKEKLDHVLLGDIETLELPYEKEQFDCVIFGDVLDRLLDPWAVVEKVKPYIKKEGVILASIPNVSHISVLSSLLAGNWTYTEYGSVDKTHIRFFTFNEMIRMFFKAGYSISKVDRVYVDYKTYQPLIGELHEVCQKYNLGSGFLAETVVFQYIIEAEKTDI
ncbi:class I SAM-dependent methyltransferase [Bacillus sp. FSL R10-2201]|uniref:class I SAM-dependent methyltransferase n=1 Tax=Bacillus sp. FSL R10-2201 TaxID=2954657 RepID=UPI0030FA30BA